MTQELPTAPPALNEDDDEIDLLDLAQTVVENLRLLVLGPLAAGLVALGISFVVPPTFTATTRFLPPQQQQSAMASMLGQLGALGGLAGAAAGIKNPADQYVALLQSETVANAIIDRFKLLDRYEAEFKQDVRKTLTGITSVKAGKDGIIQLDFDDKDPAFAAQVANAYVTELGSVLNRLALTEAQQRRQFFEKQLEQTKQNLTRAQQALQAVGINANALKSDPQAAVTLVAQLQAQIAAKEVQLGAMRGYLTPSAPDFRQVQNELVALRVQLTKAESATSSSASAGTNADYVARYRDFKYHETLFELFAKQYELARVDEAREGAVIQVVDPAMPPERKSKPKKALIAVLTTLATGFMLLLWVFVRQALRNSQADPGRAEKLNALTQAWRRALGRR